MHWAQWRRKAPDGTWLDVPQLYRRCADLIDAGFTWGRQLNPAAVVASIVLFDDDEHDLAPALWIPMTPFWDYYKQSWDARSAAAAFRGLADRLDAEVPPHRRHGGNG